VGNRTWCSLSAEDHWQEGLIEFVGIAVSAAYCTSSALVMEFADSTELEFPHQVIAPRAPDGMHVVD
jgi:hypothetical protein